ncbi:MAG: 30S ribosomal protein S15 [FCB group bacterium]|nr:30S ribosomal protein S15 [FCB group bacterium]
MSITKERTSELIQEFGLNSADSGNVSVQIAILTQRIRTITEHVKIHKKDHSGRRGLIQLVSKRRRLLNYLKRTEPKAYVELIAKLGIRK